MRTLAVIVLAIGTSFTCSTGRAVEKTDLQLLQGTWVVVKMESNGKTLSDEKLKKLAIVVTIKDRVMTKTEEGKTDQVSFVVRSTGRPKEIDAVPIQGDRKGETIQGVYSVDTDDNFKLCLRTDPKAKGRPTGFNTKSKSGDTTLIMKRQSDN